MEFYCFDCAGCGLPLIRTKSEFQNNIVRELNKHTTLEIDIDWYFSERGGYIEKLKELIIPPYPSFPPIKWSSMTSKYEGRENSRDISPKRIIQNKEPKKNRLLHRYFKEIRRTVSSLLNQKHPRRLVATLLGHTEATNEGCYDYDTSDNIIKFEAVRNLYPFVPREKILIKEKKA